MNFIKRGSKYKLRTPTFWKPEGLVTPILIELYPHVQKGHPLLMQETLAVKFCQYQTANAAAGLQ